MANRFRRSKAGISRREMFLSGGAAAAAGLAGASSASAAPARIPAGPEVYSRLGVKPFINCTATYTINGGSQMLPEVISTIEQASHYHVNLDELMDKVGERLAQLLEVEWGIVTAGTAAAITHATAGALAGTDPEKMQWLPNLAGLKNEAIIPKESRTAYDHAMRMLGVKFIEVNSPEELENALSHRTAIIYILGAYFGNAKFGLKEIAPAAKKMGVPIVVDAAADYLIVPNPYIAQGADMVAYSGGKILRGPQTAGLLVGRKDLVKAAWANSAPHHAFGRSIKVSKEEIVGMVRAVEYWRQERDITADFKEWESWYSYITEQVTRVPGVKTQLRGPARGGPFPTLNVSWDPKQIDITAEEVGEKMLNGEPRIMTHASGPGSSFLIRPVAMKPGEYKEVARRLHEVLNAAPKGRGKDKPAIAAPAADLSGGWEVAVDYEVGSAKHKLFLTAKGNHIAGSHNGWAFQGDVRGKIEGDQVELRSVLPAGGQHLAYTFRGKVSGDTMSGDVDLGEYGRARFSAKRHSSVSA